MAEHLVIRLHETARGEGAWIVVDAAGPRVGTAGEGPLSEALRHAHQRRVVVLVPGTEVLMTNATLPVRGAARMLQAVPFALEERLAEDVDALHFAIGKRRDDGSVPVAVVRRRTMDGWLETLREAGLQPAVMAADTVGIPAAAGAAAILVEGQRVYLRDESGSVAAFPVHEFGHYAEALGLAQPDSEADPAQAERANVIIYIGNDERDRHGDLIESLARVYPRAETNNLPNGAFARLAVNAARDPQPDLLQGLYAPRTSLERYWKPWRAAATLLGLLAIVLTGVKAAENVMLAREEARLDTQILAVFEQAMPGSRPVEMRKRMADRLAESRGGDVSGSNDFLQTLEILASALAATDRTVLEALNHQNRIMSIKLKAPNVQSLDQIKQAVDEAGLKAEISSAEPSDNGVDGRMRVSPGDAA